MRCTAWHAIAKALAAEGVEYIFGLPGNPQILIEDLVAHTDIKFVLVRSESWAVACAYAYARMSGKPGIVWSNPGPGTTNLVTGLLEATSGCVPVIAIANGVVERQNGMGAFQELDTTALMRPVTKWAVRVNDTRKMNWVMQRAFTLARNGRPGAVFIDIPTDLGADVVEMDGPYRSHLGRQRTRPEAASVAAAADLVAEARRPLLLCGSGAVAAGASSAVRGLSESLGIPVFVTPGGRGIVAEDDPLFLGLTGLYFNDAGRSYYDSADLVISVGSRLEAFSTLSWSAFPKGARFIQIDIDADTIAMNWRPDVAVIGDALLALEDIAAALERRIDAAAVADRAADIVAAKALFLDVTAAEAAEHRTPIRPPQVLAALNRVFGRDTILVNENGATDLWSYYWPYYQVLSAGDCVPMAEQTAMGFGVAGTIGAKLARPDKKVVCVVGDGALQMAMMELATAAEWKCGVTWVVFNNQAFGWPQYLQVLKGQEPVATGFKVAADLAAIARAQGCHGVHVEAPGDVEPALREALAANLRGVPALVDIRIARHDYTAHFQAVQRGRIQK